MVITWIPTKWSATTNTAKPNGQWLEPCFGLSTPNFRQHIPTPVNSGRWDGGEWCVTCLSYFDEFKSQLFCHTCPGLHITHNTWATLQKCLESKTFSSRWFCILMDHILHSIIACYPEERIGLQHSLTNSVLGSPLWFFSNPIPGAVCSLDFLFLHLPWGFQVNTLWRSWVISSIRVISTPQHLFLISSAGICFVLFHSRLLLLYSRNYG